jgi:general secretion pathway protein C
LATCVLWLLAAGSVVYWALKFVQGTATPANAAVVATATPSVVDSTALARGLGGGIAPNTVAARADFTSAPAINASRFVLTGVVAGKAVRQGIALIAVDGKPAKPYRVGAPVTDGVVLKSVAARQVELAVANDAPAAVTLDLPKASALVGTAVPTTPVPAPTFTPAPAVVTPPPMPVPAPTPTGSVTAPVTSEATNPGAVPGQMPARAGAMRGRVGRETAKEAARADLSAPAGVSTQ